MIITLNEDVINNNHSNLSEIIYLMLLYNNVSIPEIADNLMAKGYISLIYKNSENELPTYVINNSGSTFLENIILDSEKYNGEGPLKQLAIKLKEIFPKGKKPGTNCYWSEGVQLIIRRLKLFFKKYGDSFSNKDIINAAEKYVKSFNGNYTYMKVLKYFIFKEKVNAVGEVEGESDLISYIENAEEENEVDQDWTTTLI